MVDFKNLKVWHRAVDLTLEVYRVIKGFPKEERFVMVDQLRRSVNSVYACIAEGCRSGTDGELIYYLGKSRGSCGETEAHLIVSGKLGYIGDDEVKRLSGECDEICRMISGYINHLRKKKDKK